MDLAGARAFIDDRFLRAYGARNAASFVEHLGVARGDTGRAVLGYRRAGSEPLFTERYLDQSIEEAVSAAFGRTVERHRIVEIGNLAADNAWSMLALWGKAANDLGGSSEIAVATLTTSLRRMFARIGVPLRLLAPATAARLGDAAQGWGGYYRTVPWVCAGLIPEGQRAIARLTAARRRRAA